MSVVNLQGTGDTEQTRGPRRVEQTPERVAARRTASSSSAANSDAVKVSGRAERARNLIANLRALPEIRQERVDDLQSQMRAGFYSPAPEQVARAIVQAA